MWFGVLWSVPEYSNYWRKHVPELFYNEYHRNLLSSNHCMVFEQVCLSLLVLAFSPTSSHFQNRKNAPQLCLKVQTVLNRASEATAYITCAQGSS